MTGTPSNSTHFSRRAALGGLASAGALMARASRAGTKAPAKSLYQRAMVIDAQGGINVDPATLTPDFAAIAASGVTAVSITVADVGNGPDRYLSALHDMAIYSGICANHPDKMMVAYRDSDLIFAKQTGRIAVIFNFQDSNPLESDLSRLDELTAAGLRTVQMTYNLRNLAGDGSLEPANGGLSKWGHQVLDAVEAHKMLVDISHGGQRTMLETAQAAKRPLTISHTGCRALVDVPRNADDTVMKTVADKGGVVGIYFMPFLRQPGTGMAQSSDLIAHIEHAASVCGEDHIGIGTDGSLTALVINDKARADQKAFFEARKAKGIAAPGEAPDVFNIVEDYNRPDRLERLAFDLGKRGWSDGRIEKLLGANFLRLYKDVWPS